MAGNKSAGDRGEKEVEKGGAEFPPDPHSTPPALRSGIIQAIFAQNRFQLRSAIVTQ